MREAGRERVSQHYVSGNFVNIRRVAYISLGFYDASLWEKHLFTGSLKIVASNWLHSYLIDSRERNLCTQVFCTTCGALEFRVGVYRALATATPGLELEAAPDAPTVMARFIHPMYGEPTAEGKPAVGAHLARALADVQPNGGAEAKWMEPAARYLVLEISRSIGEAEAARILGDSWGGGVLRRMREHDEARQNARRAKEEFESPASIQKRREDKKRLAQEWHQRRLAEKKDWDDFWRQEQREARGGGEPDRSPWAKQVEQRKKEWEEFWREVDQRRLD